MFFEYPFSQQLRRIKEQIKTEKHELYGLAMCNYIKRRKLNEQTKLFYEVIQFLTESSANCFGMNIQA
jgi:hypothetical protein